MSEPRAVAMERPNPGDGSVPEKSAAVGSGAAPGGATAVSRIEQASSSAAGGPTTPAKDGKGGRGHDLMGHRCADGTTTSAGWHQFCSAYLADDAWKVFEEELDERDVQVEIPTLKEPPRLRNMVQTRSLSRMNVLRILT